MTFDIYINHDCFFFVAFTEEQFDYVLSRAVPISIIIAVTSFGLMISFSIVNSAFSTKGMHNKIKTTIITTFYIIAICFMFAISLVSNNKQSQMYFGL